MTTVIRFVLAGAVAASTVAPLAAQSPRVGTSPWGPHDEIGTLNMMTPASRAAVLSRADASRVFDLSVEYFVGMPSWHLLGDPRYQYWLTHTPRGTAVDDPASVGHAQNQAVAYTGDAVSMYTHRHAHRRAQPFWPARTDLERLHGRRAPR